MAGGEINLLLAGSFIDIIIIAIAVILSIVLHELAHGYVALWNGDYTAKVNGRLTLNPISHFDLFGFIMLFTVGFGYAKPVPVNPYNFRHQKTGIFTVAIAGITLNFILAFLSAALVFLMFLLGNKVFPNASNVFEIFQRFFEIMVTINLSLMMFNLIPIYPLDGFRIIEAFTRFTNPVTKFIRDYGSYFLIGLIGLSLLTSLLSRYTSDFFMYFDILGLYINTFVNWIRDFLYWFWQLIIPI